CLGHFLKHRSQAGVDYVWSYGPLGYFTTAAFDPDLFAARVAWELVVKLALAWLLLRLADGVPGRGWRAPCGPLIFPRLPRAGRLRAADLHPPSRGGRRPLPVGRGARGPGAAARRERPAGRPGGRDGAPRGAGADQVHLLPARRRGLAAAGAGPVAGSPLPGG